jgi:hypothetical protein
MAGKRIRFVQNCRYTTLGIVCVAVEQASFGHNCHFAQA